MDGLSEAHRMVVARNKLRNYVGQHRFDGCDVLDLRRWCSLGIITYVYPRQTVSTYS